MKWLTTFGLCLMFLLPVRGGADPAPVVVELFTSQGCSSCPPADDLMHDLAARPDVIALALHVDYWDYIGWKDTFAQEKFTVRQKGYASAGGRRMIYTPQMVVMGQQDVVGAKAMKLAELIAAHQATPKSVSLQVDRRGDVLSLMIDTIAADPVGAADVFLVRYSPVEQVEILRGENAGRAIEYVNTVTHWSHVGTWDGQAPVQVDAEILGDAPAVVLVQSASYGPILAAARVGGQ